MAQTEKTKSRLIPGPRQLQKALQLSADSALRLAQAFGKKVPVAAPARPKRSTNSLQKT